MARVRFQLDEHMPRALSTELRRRGIEVVTSADSGLLGASDVEQLDHAHRADYVVVTSDSDFVELHHRGHPHAGIAYFPKGRQSIGYIVTSLILMFETTDSDQMKQHIEYL